MVWGSLISPPRCHQENGLRATSTILIVPCLPYTEAAWHGKSSQSIGGDQKCLGEGPWVEDPKAYWSTGEAEPQWSHLSTQISSSLFVFSWHRSTAKGLWPTTVL